MVEHQGPRRHAWVQILVHGQDISTRLFPYLISVQVLNTIENAADECHIELDDRNAELQIPPDDAELQVAMGWAGEGPRLFDSGRGQMGMTAPVGNVIEMSAEEIRQEAKFGGPGLRLVFDGYVTNVESGFGRRGGGRRMWIEAKGHNDKGNAKETQKGFLGEGKEDDSSSEGGKKIPLKDMMSKVFGMAGMSVAMSPSMEKISRDYWSINDSPQNFGRRMAAENGGIFKIMKDKAVMVGRREGIAADGTPMPVIEAIWGINLIGWRIKPYVGRPQYGEAASRHFDINKGAWETVKQGIKGGTPHGGTNAVANAVNSVADKGVAEQTNKGTGDDTSSKRGIGWVLLNGEPRAQAGGFVYIDGARPGIDGQYVMSEVEHNYTRGVGFTTRAKVTDPSPKAGGFGWEQDPGPGDIPASTEPYGPPEPPGESWEPSEAEQEARRIQEAAPRPGQPGAPSPPISAEQSYTAEELEAIRRANEAAQPVSPPISF